MPREYVFGDQFAVSVGWFRGEVQVATIMKLPADSEPHPQRNLKALVDSWSEEEAAVLDGLYVDLDRRQLNDLIRKLRHARDKAFGRDE